MRTRTITDFQGRILGYIDTKPNGDETARAFSGVILGYYNVKMDHTTAFSGVILSKGNILSSLIIENTKTT